MGEQRESRTPLSNRSTSPSRAARLQEPSADCADPGDSPIDHDPDDFLSP
jgi:hypothetical protein